MTIISPCYECTQRQSGCHANCEKFLHFKCEQDARKEKLYESKRKEWWLRGFNPVRYN